MTTTAPAPDEEAIPEDRFGVRIAIIRACRGWNYQQASEACDIGKENWRLWEKTTRTPHDYEDVCRRIARGSGFSRRWISAGGPLRSIWTVVPAGQGVDQLALHFDPPPSLELVREPVLS